MPNRSIRDEMQKPRNQVRPSDPAQVRAALAGKSSSSQAKPASATTAMRPDRPTVRGQSGININRGQAVRAQMDQNLEKFERGE